jgi:hypothetical protein
VSIKAGLCERANAGIEIATAIAIAKPIALDLHPGKKARIAESAVNLPPQEKNKQKFFGLQLGYNCAICFWRKGASGFARRHLLAARVQ